MCTFSLSFKLIMYRTRSNSDSSPPSYLHVMTKRHWIKLRDARWRFKLYIVFSIETSYTVSYWLTRGFVYVMPQAQRREILA